MILLTACIPAQEAEKSAVLAPGTYDQTSWQTMVSADCQSFFDGCNDCFRAAGTNLTACTKMFCETYAEPKCVDEVEVDLR